MNFVKHPTNNHAFGAPPNWDQQAVPCGTLPVTIEPRDDGGAEITSFWQPSADELIELNSGGLVTLCVFGRGHPVVAMGVAPRPTREQPQAPSADTPRRRAGD